MSKHNYSQYSNKKKRDGNEKTNPFANVNKTAANVEPLTVKMAVERSETAHASAESTVEPVVLMGPIETIPETVTGIVANCAKLNVRSEPDITSDIVCVLDVTSEIEINVNESNGEWFKICTATGVEGYCMRKFVEAQL